MAEAFAARLRRAGGGRTLVGPLPLLAGTALALFLSSAALFDRYIGTAGVAAYALYASVGIALLWRAIPTLRRKVTERQAVAGILLVIVALVPVLLIGYRVANSGMLGGGSDRDEALNIAALRLLAGQYPYHALTYLDNPISPMPGAVILAVPFVLLGTSAFQNLAWLTVLPFAVRPHLNDRRDALWLLLALLVLAPAVLYAVVTGSDLLANSIYVLVGLLWFVAPGRRPMRGKRSTAFEVATAAFLGLGLSSRANFLLLLPLAVAALAQDAGWRRALRSAAITALTWVLVTLPFWLYDPAGFTPLRTISEVAMFGRILPRSEFWIPAATALLALALLALPGARWPRVFRDAALVQGLPVLVGVVLPFVVTGRLYLVYGLSFGEPALLFAMLYFWLRRGPAAVQASKIG